MYELSAKNDRLTMDSGWDSVSIRDIPMQMGMRDLASSLQREVKSAAWKLGIWLPWRMMDAANVNPAAGGIMHIV